MGDLVNQDLRGVDEIPGRGNSFDYSHLGLKVSWGEFRSRSQSLGGWRWWVPGLCPSL